ncbi:germination protein YpeB [Peptococcaceae bacterium 1198_IL3148]
MRRWGAFALLSVALLAAVGFWGYRQYQARQDLETFLNNKYQMAFFNLSTNVQNLQTALGKSLTASGKGEDVAIFSEIWLRADSAQGDIAQLPVSSAVTERTSKFLAQAGDYAYTISKEIVDKEELSEQNWSTLNRLYRQAAQLNSDLQNIGEDLTDGKLTLGELKTGAQNQLANAEGADKSFDSVNRNMQSYPTLIYDGPFSDHLAKRKAEGLTGEKISADEARKIALDFVDKGDNNYSARVIGKNKGRINAYTVEVIPNNDNNENLPRYTCDVSAEGGKVIWYLGNKQVKDDSLSIDQATDRAKQFLDDKGIKNMRPTYHSKNGNLVTIQFAAVQGDVMIYPDQVKCTVALDDGRILGYEASQYWMAKKDRNIPQPKISSQQAKQNLNNHLEVKNSRLAIIPLVDYSEQLCWEFTGTINQDTYLVYINAETGKKEKVMMLVDTPNGQLTM